MASRIPLRGGRERGDAYRHRGSARQRGYPVAYSTIEQQSARHGASGTTPRAKKFSYTGTTRRPIEELLNTPEGKAWLRRYMTAGVGE